MVRYSRSAAGFGTPFDISSRGIAASIARARGELGYTPRYSSLGALREALSRLAANGQADIGARPFPAL